MLSPDRGRSDNNPPRVAPNHAEIMAVETYLREILHAAQVEKDRMFPVRVPFHVKCRRYTAVPL